MGTRRDHLESRDAAVCRALRRSLSQTTDVKCEARMDAAVPMDAKNAPTGTWKTAQNTVSHSAHTHHRFRRRKEQNEKPSTSSTHEIPDSPGTFEAASLPH